MGERGTKDGLRASKSGLGLVRASLDGWLGLCKNGGSGELPFSVGVGKKSEEFMFIKQGQHRDVRAQRCDIPEGLFASITTLRPTSRRSRRVRSQCRDMEIQCRDVPGSL